MSSSKRRRKETDQRLNVNTPHQLGPVQIKTDVKGGNACTPNVIGSNIQNFTMNINMNTECKLIVPGLPLEEVVPSSIVPEVGCSTCVSSITTESVALYKQDLTKSYKKVHEGLPQHGTSALLNEIYTDLYITEGGGREVNTEHEVRQIETVSRRPTVQEKPIKCSQLFKDKAIRTVLTKGVAGIGKSISVQKFILDWAEGKENQDVLFIFPLPFRELNLMKEKRLSLMELLHQFFPKIKELKSIDCDSSKVLFIFDGLDECRLSLDFQNNERLWNVTQSASVDVLLTNLIKGNLLPSALLWITSRPAAANQIPPECVAQVTEVQGFSDPQKEEYFRKRITDQSLANQIISHIKSSRSLYIMCHIPVFCWISATVLERVLGGAEGGETPKTLTQMFTHFLIFQIKHKEQKYQGKQEVDLQKTREHVLALGKLAFQQLEKGNLIFYEDELKECGIDVREVSLYSGVCTQIFRQEFELHLGKVFSFVHLSVQEFLAALYVFLSFISSDEPEQRSTDLSGIFRASTMSKFLKSAVDKALQSENGHLDLFLRFLLGLSLDSSQILLRGILTQAGIRFHSTEETVQYIKEKIRENPSPETSVNLFHCLNELGDHSLVQEVQEYLRALYHRRLRSFRLSTSHWSALVFLLLKSEEDMENFDLSKYHPSEECFLNLLPVVKASRRAWLWHCDLTEKSCAALASALSSKSSSLRELDLSDNKGLQDSGVNLLCDDLKNLHCKLETLRLCACNLTEESCVALASALSSNSSSLRELHLSRNVQLQDSGVEQLCTALESPHCKLETLRLCSCSISERSCTALASALSCNSSSLRELDLGGNKLLQDSGVELLCVGLKSPQCKLETLRLYDCNLMEQSGEVLALALSSNSSGLKELDLSENKHLQDSGVELLCVGLENPHCKLETLNLCNCNLSENSCAALAKTLSSNCSSLRELFLSFNDQLKDSGVKLLCVGLENPHCKLKTLDLSRCSITDEGCAALASALKANLSHLRELCLFNNNPGELGKKRLSDLQKDPRCKLEKILF